MARRELQALLEAAVLRQPGHVYLSRLLSPGPPQLRGGSHQLVPQVRRPLGQRQAQGAGGAS